MVFLWTNRLNNLDFTENLDVALDLVWQGVPVLAIKKAILHLYVETGIDFVPYFQELHKDGTMTNTQLRVEIVKYDHFFKNIIKINNQPHRFDNTVATDPAWISIEDAIPLLKMTVKELEDRFLLSNCGQRYAMVNGRAKMFILKSVLSEHAKGPVSNYLMYIRPRALVFNDNYKFGNYNCRSSRWLFGTTTAVFDSILATANKDSFHSKT